MEGRLKELHINNNPLTKTPDFLWTINSLKEPKTNGKLAKDFLKNA